MYKHLYVGILSLNCLHIKTNQKERLGAYSKNRRGPKIDTRGMPQEILDKSEKSLFMLTLNTRSDKNNLNQAFVFSEKPRACNLRRRIS